MIWRRIFRFVPVPIIYTAHLPEGVGGRAIGPLAQIRPLYRERGDEGIHQHELEHVRQFWRAWLIAAALAAPAAYFVGAMAMIGAWALGAAWDMQAALVAAVIATLPHPLLYRLVRRYRLYAEASAYAEQMRHPDGQGGALSLEDAAWRLSQPRYDLRIGVYEARAAIATV